MIVVRDLFQLKFGKAREARAALKEMQESVADLGIGEFPRVLTDLVGQSYTLVLESTFESLAAYEEGMAKIFSSEEWRSAYQSLVPLIESGKREIFTVVDL